MAATATGIILVAGTITFGNEWYQTNRVNWKIPLATLIAAAGFDGLARIDGKAAVGLSIIVLIGAFTARFNGASVADTVSQFFSGKPASLPKSKTRVKVA